MNTIPRVMNNAIIVSTAHICLLCCCMSFNLYESQSSYLQESSLKTSQNVTVISCFQDFAWFSIYTPLASLQLIKCLISFKFCWLFLYGTMGETSYTIWMLAYRSLEQFKNLTAVILNRYSNFVLICCQMLNFIYW